MLIMNSQTCRSFGFYERTCPIVFTIEGDLIGDGASFVEHVRDRYGKVLGMAKESQKRRTNDNINKINEEMRKKEKYIYQHRNRLIGQVYNQVLSR